MRRHVMIALALVLGQVPFSSTGARAVEYDAEDYTGPAAYDYNDPPPVIYFTPPPVYYAPYAGYSYYVPPPPYGGLSHYRAYQPSIFDAYYGYAGWRRR
jgi:hypothetical protein